MFTLRRLVEQPDLVDACCDASSPGWGAVPTQCGLARSVDGVHGSIIELEDLNREVPRAQGAVSIRCVSAITLGFT